MRDTNYTWKGQLAVGAAGEKVVRDWLETRGLYALDVTGEPSYQRDDIDFIVSNAEDEQWFTAEVKTDTYRNGNVFFETQNAEGLPGALFKSRASVWYIYKSATGLIIEVAPARVIAFLWLHRYQYRAGQLLPVKNERGEVRAFGVRLSTYTLLRHCGARVYSLEESNESGGNDPAAVEGSGEAAS